MGGMVRRSGITATWAVVSNRVGKFTLGPATFAVDGRQHVAVPAGRAYIVFALPDN